MTNESSSRALLALETERLLEKMQARSKASFDAVGALTEDINHLESEIKRLRSELRAKKVMIEQHVADSQHVTRAISLIREANALVSADIPEREFLKEIHVSGSSAFDDADMPEHM
jgi:chromosome segregation ATPase